MPASSDSSTHISPPRSVKSLTCYFWASNSCKYSENECLYSHHHTGRIANGPTRREAGRPAVAGKNAFKDQPVYQDWRAAHQHHQNETNNAINRQLQHIRNKAQAQPQAQPQSANSMAYSTEFHGDSADCGEPVFGISGSVNFVPAKFPVDENKERQQLSGMRQVTPSFSASVQPANESVTPPTEVSTICELPAQVHHLLSTKDAVIIQMSREIDNLTAHLQGQREKFFHEIRTIMQVVHNFPVEPIPCPSPDAICPPYGRLPTNPERLLIAAQNMTRALGSSAVLLNSMQEARADISSRLEGLGEGYLVARGWSRQRTA